MPGFWAGSQGLRPWLIAANTCCWWGMGKERDSRGIEQATAWRRPSGCGRRHGKPFAQTGPHLHTPTRPARRNPKPAASYAGELAPSESRSVQAFSS